ncbi:MAG TPA: pitrilysin family protein [Gemmatimonadaceae bacterium]|nr:pitrilysin family protein [Gemmatimonadaceae bacterium]
MTAAATRPAPGPPRPYNFPAFTRTRLANGAVLLVAPVRRLPLCALAVVVDAGAELDPAGLEGCAIMTARALEEGTRQHQGLEFTEQLERIGAALSATADWDSASFSLPVMAERLPAALELLAGVIREPAFPSTELERLREERLSEIAQMRSEPRGLASETFSRVVYDTRSRYAVPLGGSEASVRALTRDVLVRHHQSFFAPDRMTIIITGDVAPRDVEQIVERAFGTWAVPSSPAEPRQGTPAAQSARVFVLDRKDAPQSELRVGHPGVPRAHPDYFPLVLLNAILGGLFSSRINLNLREEHAYTYGAHSAFDWRRGPGPFMVRTAVESGVTAAAVSEILKEISRLREEPVTDAELSLARDYLAGVFPVRFETSLAIAAGLAQMITYDLPADFYDTYRASIGSVTADEILRSAKMHLQPERLSVVVVGDAGQVREQLRELNLGEPAELPAEESDPTNAATAAPTRG